MESSGAKKKVFWASWSSVLSSTVNVTNIMGSTWVKRNLDCGTASGFLQTPRDWNVLKHWQVSSDNDMLSLKCLSAAVCVSWWNKSSQQLFLGAVLSSGDKTTVEDSECPLWCCSSKGENELEDKKTFDKKMLNWGGGGSFMSPGHGSRWTCVGGAECKCVCAGRAMIWIWDDLEEVCYSS